MMKPKYPPKPNIKYANILKRLAKKRAPRMSEIKMTPEMKKWLIEVTLRSFKESPEQWTLDTWHLTNGRISIWVASGPEFYRFLIVDYGGPGVHLVDYRGYAPLFPCLFSPWRKEVRQFIKTVSNNENNKALSKLKRHVLGV